MPNPKDPTPLDRLKTLSSQDFTNPSEFGYVNTTDTTGEFLDTKSQYLEGETLKVGQTQKSLDELKAKRQALWDKVGNGLVKGGFTAVGGTIAGTAGTLEGLITTAGTDNKFYQGHIYNLYTDLEKDLEETNPHYYSEAEKQGNVLDQTLLSQNFWTNDILKGLGFVASSYVPGTAVSKFGNVLRASAINSKLGKLGQTVNKLTQLANQGDQTALKTLKAINTLDKTIQGTSNLTAGLIGRVHESALEARQTYEDAITNGATEEEARNLENYVYWGNMSLGISDAVQFARIYGKAGNRSRDIFNIVKNETPEGLVYTIDKGTKLNRFSGTKLSGILSNAAQEFAEEGFQYDLQKTAENLAKNKTLDNTFDKFSDNFLSTSVEALSDKDFWKSGIAGAVIGGGMQGGGYATGALSENQVKENNTKKAIDYLNTFDPKAANKLRTSINSLASYTQLEEANNQLNVAKKSALSIISDPKASQESKTEAFNNIGKIEANLRLNDNLQFSQWTLSRIASDDFDNFINELEMYKSEDSEIPSSMKEYDDNGNEISRQEAIDKKINRARKYKNIYDNVTSRNLGVLSDSSIDYMYSTLVNQEYIKEKIKTVQSKLIDKRITLLENDAYRVGEEFYNTETQERKDESDSLTVPEKEEVANLINELGYLKDQLNISNQEYIKIQSGEFDRQLEDELIEQEKTKEANKNISTTENTKIEEKPEEGKIKKELNREEIEKAIEVASENEDEKTIKKLKEKLKQTANKDKENKEEKVNKEPKEPKVLDIDSLANGNYTLSSGESISKDGDTIAVISSEGVNVYNTTQFKERYKDSKIQSSVNDVENESSIEKEKTTAEEKPYKYNKEMFSIAMEPKDLLSGNNVDQFSKMLAENYTAFEDLVTKDKIKLTSSNIFIEYIPAEGKTIERFNILLKDPSNIIGAKGGTRKKSYSQISYLKLSNIQDSNKMDGETLNSFNNLNALKQSIRDEYNKTGKSITSLPVNFKVRLNTIDRDKNEDYTKLSEIKDKVLSILSYRKELGIYTLRGITEEYDNYYTSLTKDEKDYINSQLENNPSASFVTLVRRPEGSYTSNNEFDNKDIVPIFTKQTKETNYKKIISDIKSDKDVFVSIVPLVDASGNKIQLDARVSYNQSPEGEKFYLKISSPELKEDFSIGLNNKDSLDSIKEYKDLDKKMFINSKFLNYLNSNDLRPVTETNFKKWNPKDVTRLITGISSSLEGKELEDNLVVAVKPNLFNIAIEPINKGFTDSKVINSLEEEANNIEESDINGATDITDLIRRSTSKDITDDIGASFESDIPPFKLYTQSKLATDFSKVKENISRILPDFITVDDIQNISARVLLSGSEVGAFFKNCIYIADQSLPGIEYHEAFHAVFRGFLSPSDRQRYYDLMSSKVSLSREDILNYKNLHPLYSKLSNDSIKNLIYEEVMADRFMDYMNNKPTTLLGSLFRTLKRFIDWVKSIFVKSNGDNELIGLFESIDKGAFRNSSYYQHSPDQPVAFKLIPGLTAKQSDDKVRLLTSLYVDRVLEDGLEKNSINEEIINELIDTDEDLIDDTMTIKEAYIKFNVEENNVKALSEVLAIKGYAGKISEDTVYKLSATKESKAILKEQVVKYLKYISYIDNSKSNIDSTEVDNNEANSSKNIDFDSSSFEIGGINNINGIVKAFIGLTKYVDKNGNVKVVDLNGVYSLLTRNLANIFNQQEAEEKLQSLANYNEEIKAIRDKLYNNDPKNGSVVSDRVKTLFWKAFQREAVEYITIIDDNGSVKINYPNRLDGALGLISNWEAKFEANNIMNNESTKSTLKSLSSMLSRPESITSNELQTLSDLVNNIGLGISKEAIENKFTESEEEFLKFVNDIKAYAFLYIAKNKSPYRKGDNDMLSRLANLAYAEANVNSSVYESSIQNAEGKNIFTYVKSSYILSRMRELKEGKLDNYLKTDTFKNNLFVKNNSVKNIQYFVFNGFSKDTREDKENTTFKNISKKHWVETVHKAFFKDDKSVFVAPFVFEAKSTNIFVKVNHNKNFISKGNLTEEGINSLIDILKSDLDRIAKVRIDLGIDGGTPLDSKDLIEGYHTHKILDLEGNKLKVTKDNIEDIIAGKYRVKKGNTLVPSTINDLPKGLVITTFPTIKKYSNKLFNNFKDSNPEYIKEVENWFKKDFVNSLYVEYKDMLTSIDVNNKEDYSKLIGKDIKTDIEYINAGKYFAITDFIYSYNYSNLIRPDEALFKDGVDITKRAAGLVASGDSLTTDNSTANVVLLQDDEESREMALYRNGKVEKTTVEGINTTDAQGYVTGERLKFILKNLGKIDSNAESILDKLIRGESVSNEWKGEFFTNSLKNVYYDGDLYIKCSIFPLFKEFTSNLVDGKWISKPGLEKLHNLREQMENNGIDEAYHESAFKLVKKNKQSRKPIKVINSNKEELEIDGYEFNRSSIQKINNSDWRLQVETPTGKTEIVDGTQLIQLIDSEANDDTEVTYKGTKYKVKALRDDYQRLLSEIRETDMDKAVSFVNKMVDGKSLFVEKALRNLEASNADSYTIEMFQQDRNGVNDFKQSTNLPHLTSKFEELYLSHFNKKVFQQKAPGMKLTLVTSQGYTIWDDKLKQYRNLRIHGPISTEGMGKYSKSEELGYAEVVLSEELLHNYGLTRELFEKQPKDIQDEILTMLGFRIPTQSHHSMIPFKVVGWLPAYYGSVIIAPAEITYLSGADYDIDSLFVKRKEFYVNSKGNVVVYKSDKEVKDLYDDYIQYIKDHDKDFVNFYKTRIALLDKSEYKKAFTQTLKDFGYAESLELFSQLPKEKQLTNASRYNDILDISFALLHNKEIFESLTTPASLTSAKDISVLINKANGYSEVQKVPYTTLSNRVKSWDSNAVGKKNVGVVAIANIVNAVLKKYNVPIIPFSFNDTKSFSGFNNLLENDDIKLSISESGILEIIGKEEPKRIADSLSTLVSAMTDNAKERLASKLNLTINNLGVFSTLISLGNGFNRTMVFANQPALLYATAKEMSTFDIKDLVDNIKGKIKEYISKNSIDESILENDPLSDENLVGSISFKFNPDQSIKSIQDLKDLYTQLKALEMYLVIDDYSKAFSSVGKLLQTNKDLGITFSSFKSSIEEFIKLMEKDSLIKGDFIKDIPNIMTNLDNILKAEDSIKNKFIVQNESIKEQLAPVYSCIKSSVPKDAIDKEFLSFIATKLMDKTIKDSSGKSIEESFKSLMTSKINNITELYKRAYSVNPENKFIKAARIVEPTEKNQFYSIEYNTRVPQDSQTLESIRSSFVELLTSPNKEQQEFALNLFRLLLVKDSLKFKNNSPIQLLTSSRWDFVSSLLKQFNRDINESSDVDSVIEKYFNKDLEDLVYEFLYKFSSNPKTINIVRYYKPNDNFLSSKKDKLVTIKLSNKIKEKDKDYYEKNIQNILPKIYSDGSNILVRNNYGLGSVTYRIVSRAPKENTNISPYAFNTKTYSNPIKAEGVTFSTIENELEEYSDAPTQQEESFEPSKPNVETKESLESIDTLSAIEKGDSIAVLKDIAERELENDLADMVYINGDPVAVSDLKNFMLGRLTLKNKISNSDILNRYVSLLESIQNDITISNKDKSAILESMISGSLDDVAEEWKKICNK